MPKNALGHALGQNNIKNFELLRGFITIQGIVPPPPLCNEKGIFVHSLHYICCSMVDEWSCLGLFKDEKNL